MFGGVYVSADNVPGYLKWLPRTSMIKYAYEGLCVNEFRGMEFETTGASGDLATGDQASCFSPARYLISIQILLHLIIF